MEVNKKVIELALDDVLPNRFQPRIKFNEDSLNELSESIKEHGVIQPIVVRPVGDKYEIIAGERRYKASTLAGKTTIPAIITDLNDKDSAEVALIENVQRQNLTPIEEAISYKKILDMGYLNQTTLAEKLGKNQSTVANKLRLLELDDEVQEALLNSKISERHARSLLRIQDKNEQIKMLNRIVNERMTVRKTDEEIDKVLNNMNNGINNNFANNNFMNNQNNGFVTNPIPEPQQPIPEINQVGPNVSEPMSFESLFSNNPVNNQIQSQHINESPIMNENPFEITEQPIESIEFDTINPGFMNVDKIMEEAQPVVSPTTEAPADLSNFISQYSEPVITVDPEPIMPTLEPTIESQNQQINPMPEFQDFEPQNTFVNPVEQNTQEELTPKKFFNILEETEEKVEEPTQPVQPSMTEFNFDSLFQPTTSNVSSIEQPVAEPVVEQPQVQQNYQMPEPSYQQPVQTFENIVEPVVPTPMPEELTNNVVTTSRFEKAMQVINECAQKLEQLGYKQEHDDFDLEDMYQVIFRIEEK